MTDSSASNIIYFCDSHHIESGNIPLSFEKPVKRRIVFDFDAPFETGGVAVPCLVKLPDGEYGLYYTSFYSGERDDGIRAPVRRVCMIKSKNGVDFYRPDLDLIKIPEAEHNNIISPPGYYFSGLYVFRDENPDCPPDEKYKAVYGEWRGGMYGYTSPDGVHFDWQNEKKLSMFEDTGCYYDTLNTVFYDVTRKKYTAFVRGFHEGDNLSPENSDSPDAKRDIRVCCSDTFSDFSAPIPLEYGDGEDIEMYAPGILPDKEVPGFYYGFATRYYARTGWTDSFEKLCDPGERQDRFRGTSLNDAIFISSHDYGKSFYRSNSAVFTSGPEHRGGWVYGDCYPCVGTVKIPSETPGEEDKKGYFVKETDVSGRAVLYLYTGRNSYPAFLLAGFDGGYCITKPFVLSGGEMYADFATSAAGGVVFSIVKDGQTVAFSDEYFGDSTSKKISFDCDISKYTGTEIRLKIEMKDAKLYSVRFVKEK